MCPTNQVHYFYQGDQLYLELGAEQSRTLLRTVHGPLAQVQQLNGQASVGLLSTDRQGSVLSLQNGRQRFKFVYSAFGSTPIKVLSLLGFNQQQQDSTTGCYLLGNGYRVYNPILMRFNSPDNISPFGKGGINAYAYCGGDPVNWVDPSGHIQKKSPWKPTLETIVEGRPFYKASNVKSIPLEQANKYLATTPAEAYPSNLLLPLKEIEKLKKIADRHNATIKNTLFAIENHDTINSPLRFIGIKELQAYANKTQILLNEVNDDIITEKTFFTVTFYDLTARDWDLILTKAKIIRYGHRNP
ncbi:RHS repeat-associated core domain-containing protein [Pseudomonas urmiensis]|jgi:RHS repeat-associated protein|uniref:RHS repeat-associated core domain-containing protein n=1 Tax=Pseudomonas urmiensis TaxID=2745493 RepID=UPI0034D6ACBA